MAFVGQEFNVPVADVWAVLVDPTTYPEWLIGARKIRAVDADWPAVDAAFHHRVGFWPVLVDDKSIIREIRTEELLVLEVRATPLVRGRVRLCLSPTSDGAGALLVMEEEPVYRLLGNLLRPVLDPLTHVRNKRSLQKLADVVERTARSRT
jgi:uncharacterized protein YndB with AHSA1/START domain